MAKMSRGALKSLVKECLFEILLEATDDESKESIVESHVKRPNNSKRTKRAQGRSSLDTISFGSKEKSQPRKVDVSHITADPVMAAIFQDTAATTMVEQANAERGKVSRGQGDAASQVASQNDPSQLFGEASKNWAALAFNGK
tara:strand:- start:2665 stop:3093 length:429 start_codon:yes stop_codon:yes gene_type:complete